MSTPAAILREIHRLRRHARDLQEEMERLPRSLKVQQARVTRQEEALREAQEAIKKLKVDTHSKEVTLRSKNQEIAKHQKQLNEAASKKEYDALQAEIQAERKACSALEDEILDDMTATEEQTARLPELEKAVRQAKEELGRLERDSREREAGLREQLTQALQGVKEVEAALPADVRPQYDRLVAARGEDAMTAVQNRTCAACYTEITAQNYNELLLGQFVLCKNCGRILYLPETTDDTDGTDRG